MARVTMSAAVLHGPGDLRVEQRDVPEPGPGDVLVEVSHCGICGTDLHMVVEGWGRAGSVGGHEWSGTIVAVGSDVSSFRVGDPVAGGAAPGCGTCGFCQSARLSLCENRAQPGGARHGTVRFAEFICIDPGTLVAVPRGLDLRTAALAEPLAVALHAVDRSGAAPGQRVLVTGAGPIGTLAIVALRARGITDILMSEPNPSRQALAARLGATIVDPSAFDILSIAEPSRIVDAAVDAVLECSGKPAAMEAACTQLRRAGTLVLVGTGIEPPRFDVNRILLNELVVTGSFEYDGGGIDDAVALLASGAADLVRELVEPLDVGLYDLLDAMHALAAGRIAGKVLVAPNARGGRP